VKPNTTFIPTGHDIDHEARRQSIGASEIAAIVELNPWQTPNELWRVKVGLSESFEGSALTEWGIRLEATIRDAYAEKTGYEVMPTDYHTHKLYPWATCSPDGLVYVDGKLSHGLEIKTASAYTANKWGEEPHGKVPEQYLLQCHWSMMITELPMWHLAVLINGSDFRVYEILRDESIEAMLLARARVFWFEHVLKGIPPDEFGPDRVADEYLQRKYKQRGDDIEIVGQEFDVLLENIRVAKARKEDFEREQQIAQNHMKAFIGDRVGVQGATGKATWRQGKDGRRRLRIQYFD